MTITAADKLRADLLAEAESAWPDAVSVNVPTNGGPKVIVHFSHDTRVFWGRTRVEALRVAITAGKARQVEARAQRLLALPPVLKVATIYESADGERRVHVYVDRWHIYSTDCDSFRLYAPTDAPARAWLVGDSVAEIRAMEGVELVDLNAYAKGGA
jgi:hypothetical protein